MKHYLLFIFCYLVFHLNLPAQGWERKYTRLSNYDLNAFTFAKPGGYWGARQLSTSGVSDYAIFRTDLDGNALWTKVVPKDTFVDQRVVNAIVTADQNMVAIGTDRDDPNINNPHHHIFVTKLDQNGDVIWNKRYFYPLNNYNCNGIVELPDHSFRMLTNRDTTIGTNGGAAIKSLVALDSIGNILWEKTILPVIAFGKADNLVQSSDGYLYATISSYGYLFKMDIDGNIIWTKDIGYPSGTIFSICPSIDHGVAYFESIITTDSIIQMVYKRDSDGNPEWSEEIQKILSIGSYIDYAKMSPGADGSFIVTIGTITNGTNGVDIQRILANVLPNGVTKWNRLQTYTDRFYDMAGTLQPTADGGYIIGGALELTQYVGDPILIKLDSLGNIHTNVITGAIRKDLNGDCIAQSGETALKGFIVQLTKPGADTLYTVSGNTGTYSIEADTGTYKIAVAVPNTYWQLCDTAHMVTFNGVYQTQTVNHSMKAVVNCALPEIDICTPFLRRCYESQYFVRYKNTGTITSGALTVKVVLDPYLTFTSAQITPSSISGDTLIWNNLPSLGIGASNTFWIKVIVDCDSTVLGQTHCTSAHIYPDTLCFVPANWSGAGIKVSMTCLGDTQVKATVTNTGNFPTTQPVHFIVIEDDVILDQGNQPLGPFESIVKTYAANGACFRIEATQEPNYPIPDMPSAFVEGCGGFHSLGFPGLFSQNVGSPFEDIDCTQNVDSYDPNDKQGFPKGVKEEHYIHQNEEIEYLIRFQNEGTANAAVITIRDTLSHLLDVGSLRPGASSHPYTFELIGPGVLKFKFAGINLPPKSVNEPASHGYVSFRIRQKKDNPLGSVIYNAASIYFDYNTPVITNKTWHTIGKDFLDLVKTNEAFKPNKNIKVEPNPVQNDAVISLQDVSGQAFLFELFNASGVLIRQEGFDGHTLHLSSAGLQDGIYFFRITGEKSWQGVGKFIVEKQ